MAQQTQHGGDGGEKKVKPDRQAAKTENTANKKSYFDDHESTTVDPVTIQPQTEHTMPVPFVLETHENQNGWKLYFNGQPDPMLILIFKRDEDGEETIDELLRAMERIVDAYRRP